MGRLGAVVEFVIRLLGNGVYRIEKLAVRPGAYLDVPPGKPCREESYIADALMVGLESVCPELLEERVWRGVAEATEEDQLMVVATPVRFADDEVAGQPDAHELWLVPAPDKQSRPRGGTIITSSPSATRPALRPPFAGKPVYALQL